MFKYNLFGFSLVHSLAARRVTMCVWVCGHFVRSLSLLGCLFRKFRNFIEVEWNDFNLRSSKAAAAQCRVSVTHWQRKSSKRKTILHCGLVVTVAFHLFFLRTHWYSKAMFHSDRADSLIVYTSGGDFPFVGLCELKPLTSFLRKLPKKRNKWTVVLSSQQMHFTSVFFAAAQFYIFNQVCKLHACPSTTT